MSKQYSAYENNAEIVKQMVENDYKPYVDQLYQTLGVPYIEDVKQAFEVVVSNQTGIVCTHIKFLNSDIGDTTKEEYHAVCFVRLHSTGPIYFYDPNGAVKNDSVLKFVIDGRFMTTNQLVASLKNGRPLVVKFGVSDGIQFFSTSSKSIYISGGGYCMFYIYIFMKEVQEFAKKNRDVNVVNSYVDWIVNYRYSESDSCIFPKKRDIARVSKAIVDFAFP